MMIYETYVYYVNHMCDIYIYIYIYDVEIMFAKILLYPVIACCHVAVYI